MASEEADASVSRGLFLAYMRTGGGGGGGGGGSSMGSGVSLQRWLEDRHAARKKASRSDRGTSAIGRRARGWGVDIASNAPCCPHRALWQTFCCVHFNLSSDVTHPILFHFFGGGVPSMFKVLDCQISSWLVRRMRGRGRG